MAEVLCAGTTLCGIERADDKKSSRAVPERVTGVSGTARPYIHNYAVS